MGIFYHRIVFAENLVLKLMKLYTIKVTVQLKNSLWIAIFERDDDEGYAVARHIFGAEPTDPELYEFVSGNYFALKFTEPHNNIKLDIKRKKYKRMVREVRKEMKKSSQHPPSSRAQDVLREELEKNKKVRKSLTREQKQAEKDAKFALKQSKKKKKMRGH
jgi:hypothetical protein